MEAFGGSSSIRQPSKPRVLVNAWRQWFSRSLMVGLVALFGGVWAAVPVAASETCRELGAEVDEIVCLATPEPFHAVGLWYEQFSQTTDQEVHDLLERAAQEHPVAVVK